MFKHLSTHEYAKYLLSKEDKPLVVNNSFEEGGKDFHIFSNVTGITENEAEGVHVITTDYCSAKELNTLYYEIGDGFVYLNGNEIPFISQDIEYSFEFYSSLSIKNNSYGKLVFWKKDKNNIDDIVNFEAGSHQSKIKNQDLQLDDKVKVAVTEGFYPEWRILTILEAEKWYKNKIKEEEEDL